MYTNDVRVKNTRQPVKIKKLNHMFRSGTQNKETKTHITKTNKQSLTRFQ